MQTLAGIHSPAYVNIGPNERWLTGLAGGALTTLGMLRRNLPGTMATLAGALLLYRAARGHSHLYQHLGFLLPAPDETARLQVRDAIACSATTTVQRTAEELHVAQPLRWLFGDMATRLQIVAEEPGRHISWLTPTNGVVRQTGSLEYRELPYRRGTEVRVSLAYHLPGGRLAALLQVLRGDHPGRHLQDALRRFKQFMEAGEIPTIEGQPRGGRR